jgi:twinkle protein
VGALKTWADFGIDIPSGRSGEIDLTCPKCSPQRKKKNARCLSVNVEKGVFSCAHCGFSGGLLEGAHQNEPAWRKPIYRKPSAFKPKEDGGVFEWLQTRGVSEAIAKRNGVTAARVYMPQVEEEVTAMAFPYHRNGELVNVKYRDRQKNFRMEAGAERILYGFDDIDDERCVIVEGEIDKLSIEMAGITSCVSVPDGAPTPNTKDYASKFVFLDNDWERLERVKQWVIAVDNDPPGLRLEEELTRRLGIENCLRVTWSSDCKDANDVLRSFGPAVLAECIANAQPYPIKGVITVGDISREIDRLYAEGVKPGCSTGWKSLDEYYTVRLGEMTVITGVPNSGKSNWLDALLVNLAHQHEWRFAIFSPENQPIQNHISRLMEHHSRMPFRDGPTPRMDFARMTLEKEWLAAHVQFMLPEDESDWSVEWILKTAAILVRRTGINALVIDPWNEIEQQRPKGMTETDYVSSCLRKIRQFGRRTKTHIFIVAHPQKMYRDKSGEYPVPTLYDISGSAHWRNKADNGIVVFRDINEPDKPGVEIHVQKIRFREIGKVGGVELKYDKVTGGYYDWIRPKSLPSQANRETDEEKPAWWNQ